MQNVVANTATTPSAFLLAEHCGMLLGGKWGWNNTMSVGKRVLEAFERLDEGDIEGALIPTCIAVGATAAKKYPGWSDNKAYKVFLTDNLVLITSVMCVATRRLTLNYQHAELRSDDGTCTIEQLLYHVVRCGLVHNGQLPANLHFTVENKLGGTQDHFLLPASMIYGLLAAVIVAPANSRECADLPYVLHSAGREIPLRGMWGRKRDLIHMLS